MINRIGLKIFNKKNTFVLLLCNIITIMLLTALYVINNTIIGDISINTVLFLINMLLYTLLALSIYIIANIILYNNLINIGVLSVLGIERKELIRLFGIFSIFIITCTVPIGVISGLLIAKFFIIHVFFIDKTNIIFLDIILISILCSLTIFFVIFKILVRIIKKSPLEVINGAILRDYSTIHYKKVGLNGSKFLFSFFYGIKSAIDNLHNFTILIMIVSLIVAFFLSLSNQIETEWKIGNNREAFEYDFMIQVPYVTSNILINDKVKPADSNFINNLKELNEINHVFTNWSIVDNISKVNRPSGLYNYFTILQDNLLTAQSRKLFNLTFPTKNSDFSVTDNIIYPGLSGYGEVELEYSKKFLIEGNIDLEKMSKEPIVLLPKYITNIENINIPYTKLKVGDKIKLLENKGTLSELMINQEYEYTIGGFLSHLPFRQLNGSSSGFVIIMHVNELNKLQTLYKGIIEMYITANPGYQNTTFQELEKLCFKNDYYLSFNSKKEYVENRETMIHQYTISLYSVFGFISVIIFFILLSIFTSNIISRQNDFLILNLLGLSKIRIAVLIFTESFTYGLCGFIPGTFLGYIIILSGDLRGEILNYAQLIPWIHIVSVFFIITFACVVTAITGMLLLKNSSLYDLQRE